MDLNDVASNLYGKKRTETTSKLNPNETTTIYGTAEGKSDNGNVEVYISEDTTKPDEDDPAYTPGVTVELPTSPEVQEGDTVAVTLVGAGSAKHPFVSAVIGSGDRARSDIDANKVAIEAVRTEFAQAKNDIDAAMQKSDTDISDTKKSLEDFKKDAATTYSTKTETDEKTGAITKTLEADYAKKDDVAQTYVEKATYQSDVEGINSTIQSHYTELTDYKKTNDSKVESLTNIADAAIETWTGKGEPTLLTEPTSKWNSETLKKQHSGDIYFDEDTGYAYRWDGTQWLYQKNTDITKALGDIDTIKKDYATKSELSATDEKLTASIGDNLTTAKTYADNAVATEVTNRDAAITAKANEITQSVQQTYTEKTEFNQYKEANDTAVADAKKTGTDAQTDLDEFKKSVSTTYATEAELKLTNDSITAEVDARKTTDTNLANLDDKLSKNYSTTTEMKSAIEQSATSVTTSVTESTDKKLKDLTIGGRNLAIQSTVDYDKAINETTGVIEDVEGSYCTNSIAVDDSSSYCLSTYAIRPTEDESSDENTDTSDDTSQNGSDSGTSGGDSSTTDDESGDTGSPTVEPIRNVVLAWYDSSSTFMAALSYSTDKLISETVMPPVGATSAKLSYSHMLSTKIKFEKGTKPTDWTPAPEDMATAEDLDVLNTTFTQTSEQFQFDINELNSTVDDNDKAQTAATNNLRTDLNDEINERKSYLRFSRDNGVPTVEVGSSDSDSQMRLTNEQLQFLYKQAMVAYIGNNAMSINNAVIHNALYLGGFAFIPRTNGNLGFQWVGEVTDI